MSNMLTAVDKHTVRVALNELQEELYKATSVTTESTWTELQEARKSISRAEGMYNVLHGFDLITEWRVVAENIERIRFNHEYIADEKDGYISPGIQESAQGRQTNERI